MKSFKALCLATLALLVLFSGVAFAGGGQEPAQQQDQPAQASQAQGIEVPDLDEILDPRIPQSWLEPSRNASDWGITDFSESPMLAEQVRAGTLPPVEERLPNDPMVIEPFQEIGKYGGTLQVMNFNGNGEVLGDVLGDKWGDMLFEASPDSKAVYPWMVDQFEYRDGGRELAMTFREGMKWSDGTPFIPATEFRFLWDYIYTDSELITRGPDVYGVVDLSTEGDYTVVYHFDRPQLRFHENQLVQNVPLVQGPHGIPASHFMRDFIPAIVGQAAALENAQALGFDTVQAAVVDLLVEHVAPREPEFGVPTLKPYMVVERTESEYVFERNPYYWIVDTEGNQLPYIDRVVSQNAASREIVDVKSTTGELDLSLFNLAPQNIPLYKRNEQSGDYRTFIYTDGSAAKPYYIFNFDVADTDLREVFMNVDFRRATSLAINRNEINEKIYFGFAIPAQTTIPILNPEFKEDYALSYAEYDPERAKALLDSIGMVDVDGDGFREMPGGERFAPKMMLTEAEYLGPIPLHELVVSYWQEIGLNITLDVVSASLFWQRTGPRDFDLKPHVLDTPYPFFLGTGITFSFAPMDAAGLCCGPWAEWTNWHTTGGDVGREPPAYAKRLVQLAEAWVFDGDKEALHDLLQEQADNLWTVGAIGYQPIPVVVSNRMTNVPESMIYVAGLRKFQAARPVQFFINE